MTDSANPSSSHAHWCTHGSLADHHPEQDAICLDQLSYTYPPDPFNRGAERTPALRDINLHVEFGCNLGIVGPNGAGKTTLIKIILGLITGYSGSVKVAGLTPHQATRAGNILGYVPQRAEVEWRFPLSVRQVVRMGLLGKTGFFRRYRRDDLEYADHLIELMGLAKLAETPIASLSGGQQQRMFIARALAPRPQILILDEPLVGVDELGQRHFAKLIHQLHESLNLTVIIVSHDLQAIAAGCNRVACIRQTLHYHDAPKGLTPDVLAEVFQHDIAPLH